MERTTIWLSEEDKAIFAAVRAMYGCESFSQAVRLAGRVALQTGRLNRTPPDKPGDSKTRKRRRHASPAESSFFAHMLALADEIQLDGLPEDFAEQLDQYRHGEVREQLQ